MYYKPLALAAALLLLSSGAYALPNLKLDWVQYMPASERIVAEIFNDSSDAAGAFVVNFYVDGAIIASYPLESEGELGMRLGPKSTRQVYASFPDDGKTHEFLVVADPANAIEESNEKDNSLSEKYLGEEDLIKSILEGEATPPENNSGIFSSPIFSILIGFIVPFVIVFAVLLLAVRRVRKKHA